MPLRHGGPLAGDVHLRRDGFLEMEGCEGGSGREHWRRLLATGDRFLTLSKFSNHRRALGLVGTHPTSMFLLVWGGFIHESLAIFHGGYCVAAVTSERDVLLTAQFKKSQLEPAALEEGLCLTRQCKSRQPGVTRVSLEHLVNV